MGVLREGQDGMHYSDNSHRWIAPPDIPQELWEAKLQWHMDQHLASMGGPMAPDHYASTQPGPIARVRRRRARLPEAA